MENRPYTEKGQVVQTLFPIMERSTTPPSPPSNKRGRPRVETRSHAEEHRRSQLREAQKRYQTKRDIKLGSLEKENANLRRKLSVLSMLLGEFASQVSQLDEYRGIPQLEFLLSGAKSQVRQVVALDEQPEADKSVVEILSCRSAPTPPVGTAGPAPFDVLQAWGLQEIHYEC